MSAREDVRARGSEPVGLPRDPPGAQLLLSCGPTGLSVVGALHPASRVSWGGHRAAVVTTPRRPPASQGKKGERRKRKPVGIVRGNFPVHVWMAMTGETVPGAGGR